MSRSVQEEKKSTSSRANRCCQMGKFIAKFLKIGEICMSVGEKVIQDFHNGNWVNLKAMELRWV